MTPAIVIAALGVTAVALFSASLVMAADLVSRAFVTRGPTPDQRPPTKSDGRTSEHAGLEVRLDNSEGYRPVLKIRGKGDNDSAFLVPVGIGLGDPPAFDGPLRWVPATRVRACRASQQ